MKRKAHGSKFPGGARLGSALAHARNAAWRAPEAVRSDDFGTKSFEAGPSLRGSLEERALGSTMTSLFVIGDLSCSKFLNGFLAFLIKPGF